MKHRAFGLAVCLTLLSAAPVTAQLWFFPDYAVPTAGGQDPSTWVAATFGRGLNEDSGEANAFGAFVGRTFDRVGVMGGVGRASANGESEITFGGAVGVDVLGRTDSPTMLTVQGGFGYVSEDVSEGESFTSIRIPIGVAVRRVVETSNGGTVTPWIMPRANVVRFSGFGDSETDVHIGASGGVSFTSASGLGAHAAIDVLRVSEDDSDSFNIIQIGVGGHYIIGR